MVTKTNKNSCVVLFTLLYRIIHLAVEGCNQHTLTINARMSVSGKPSNSHSSNKPNTPVSENDPAKQRSGRDSEGKNSKDGEKEADNVNDVGKEIYDTSGWHCYMIFCTLICAVGGIVWAYSTRGQKSRRN